MYSLDKSNEIKAKLLGHHERTIAILTDERPRFERKYAIEIGRFLQEQGYYVYEITVQEFISSNLALIGAMLIIPHAESVPVEFAQSLKNYWLQGGQVVVLGGPMFWELIESDGEKFVKKDLPPHVLDAQHTGKTGDITIEGLIPTHKVYLEQNASDFRTEEGQNITTAVLRSETEESVVCPVARPYGIGYQMEHRSRFIPLVSVYGKEGRANGRRGAAAFIMLNDTRGHLRFTNGSRPGSVSSTTMGSAIACIGLRRQDLMSVAGFPPLLLDIISHLFRGLYLYEAGATEFVYKTDSKVSAGASVLNTTQDFISVAVKFELCRGSTVIYSAVKNLLSMPRTYTKVPIEFSICSEGKYRLAVSLIIDDNIIDRIEQEIFAPTVEKYDKEDFVCVKGRDFVLHGKQWNMLGISYWPLFYPSFDREDYWMGWLDKSNYDPVEVERDLALFNDMGINCLFTRLDGNIFDRSIPQLKDFIQRLKNHNIKLSLSYANATNPLHYYPEAFRLLMETSGLLHDPVLFGHDISWEIGHQYFMENYLPQWTDGWIRWINERYGSLESAEKDWGVSIDRTEDGEITHPPKTQFEFDGPWRIKICAFRRYMDDMLSKVWNETVKDMRSVDPDHIIGYRMGCFYKDGGASLTSTNKHIDYSSLEGYSFMENEDGRFASQCVTKVSQLLTGNKPIVWVEYGSNLIGTSGNSAWSALKWDRKKLSPVQEKLDEQLSYYGQFFRMFKACDVAGSVPWWYAGGFRRVECSDCGIVAPNGTLRPVAEEYVKLGKEWLLKERTHRSPEVTVCYDPDVHSAGWGKFYLGSGPIDRNENSWAAAAGTTVPGIPEYGPGVNACRKAEAEGKELAFTTPGFGTDSSEFPVLAVGNVLYNGNNPPKYLDAEFNRITLYIDDKPIDLHDGDRIFVKSESVLSISAEAGNLREATWLSGRPESDGTVSLNVSADNKTLLNIPITKETPYLGDAFIPKTIFTCDLDRDLTVDFRMKAFNRADFGEKVKVTLIKA